MLRFLCLIIFALGLAGCGQSPQPPEIILPSVAPTSVPPAAATATATTASSPTAALPTATSTATPLPPPAVCSPLEGIPLHRLGEILQEPVVTPHPGQDDGHHGDDFAFWRFDGREGMEGLPIQSVLEGTVVGITDDRLPYGNMVMIETPLDRLPETWQVALRLPTPAPAAAPGDRMPNCPVDPPTLTGTGPGRSLYLLYAHLREPSPLRVGEPATCGQVIGAVGNTGLSGNPHLHLEVRVGPSGARFDPMGYYDPRASAEEFASYCTWRVSQLFQITNPLDLLSVQP